MTFTVTSCFTCKIKRGNYRKTPTIVPPYNTKIHKQDKPYLSLRKWDSWREVGKKGREGPGESGEQQQTGQQHKVGGKQVGRRGGSDTDGKSKPFVSWCVT